MIPQQVINFEVFDSGDRLLGLASVDIGTLEAKTAEISGAGIAGSIDMPTKSHFAAPEVVLHWRTLFESPLKLLRDSAKQLSLRGATQHYDAGTGELNVVPVRVDIRGHLKSNNLGKFEPSTTGDVETTLVCDWIQIKVNDKQLLEFDLFNYIFRVDESDLMSVVRSAVGL